MPGPFRALHLLRDEGQDAHGRRYGDDWNLVAIGEDDDMTRSYLTTDGVHCSEYGDLVPRTQRGLARLIAVALNEAYERRAHPAHGSGTWTDLLRECERGEPPPPPTAVRACAVCHEPIVDEGASLTAAGWLHLRCDPELF